MCTTSFNKAENECVIESYMKPNSYCGVGRIPRYSKLCIILSYIERDIIIIRLPEANDDVGTIHQTDIEILRTLY